MGNNPNEKIIERQIVLGAGASAGYPMGSELLEMLKNNKVEKIKEAIMPLPVYN